MKRKLAMMFAVMLSTCVMMSTVAGATEAESIVSGNDATVETSAEENAVEEPAVETSEETVDEEVTEETSEQDTQQPSEEVVVEAPAGGEVPDEPEIEVVEEKKKVSGGGTLAVDGYYDDWEGVPETMISYGSHNASGTVYEYHGGSILVSGGYVYVHIRMSDLYQQQIPVDDLKLTINGIERSFIIRMRNADNTINWDSAVYNLPGGIHNNLGIFYRDGAYMALGEAAVTINEASPNDSFEFRMKIADLESLYGMEPGTIENGAKLEFFSPNIGPEKITVVGSSTGTYIGILLCFAVVLSALIGQKRKQVCS